MDEYLVSQAIKAYKAGSRSLARIRLTDALKQNPNNEAAWLWLAAVVDEREKKLECLQRILKINPANTDALEAISRLAKQPTIEQIVQPPKPSSPTIQPYIPSNKPILMQPPQVTQITPPAKSISTIATIIIVLLVLLGLFWMGIGLLQLVMGLADNSTMYLLCLGPWNILIAIVHLWLINDVTKSYRKVIKDLTSLAIIGSIFGIFQVIAMEVWLQILVIPLYILIGILIQMSKEEYTVLTPKELREQQKKLLKQKPK